MVLRVGVWRDANISVLRAGYRLLPACDGQPSRSRNPALSAIFVKLFRPFLFWFSFVLFFSVFSIGHAWVRTPYVRSEQKLSVCS